MSKKGRPMRKKTKQLLIFLVVLVIVGIGVALLLLLPQSESETASSSSVASTSSTETISLISREQSEMKRFSLTNENGTIELIADIEETDSSDTSSSTAAAVTYTVTGMEDVTLLNSVVQTYAQYGYLLNAVRDIGEQSELAPFGLDDPAVVYTAEYTDGTSVTVSIGATVPGSTNNYYVMLSDDTHIYTANVYTLLSASRDSFLSSSVLYLMLTDDSGEESLPVFDKIKISGRDHEQPIVIYPREDDIAANSLLKYYSYYMSEPKEAGVSSKLEDTYLTPLATLTATGYAAVNPTEEELQEYGMDDPIEIRFWYEGEKTVLLVGKVEGSTAYVMQEDGKVIYEVNADDVALATVSAFDLSDTLMLLCDITTIKNFEFTDNNGDTYTVEQERTEKVSSSSEDSDEEAEIEYEYAAYYDGLELQYYKKFYQSFLTAYREEEVSEDAELGKKLFTLKMNFYDEYDSEPLVITAYEYSDRRVVYQINGENMALVKSSWAEKVLADFVKLINDEEIKLT